MNIYFFLKKELESYLYVYIGFESSINRSFNNKFLSLKTSSSIFSDNNLSLVMRGAHDSCPICIYIHL